MKIFKGENFLHFTTRFKNDLVCKRYLAEIKWSEGYTCKKCGHTKYTLRPDYTRTCTFCKHNESPTAGTLFHKVKFGLRKAFHIVFEMSNSTKGMSSLQVSKRYGITVKTAWFFMQKVRCAMKSSENYPMDGVVQVDEFTIGGKEKNKPGRSYNTKKKKVIGAVELTERGKIKRFYSLKINDYSSKSLNTLFEKHISLDANVLTDKWRGYFPLKKDYHITQSLSLNGEHLKELHTVIHQIKSWLRTIYSWVHPEHINHYLDEFSFRINRSIYKSSIFHKLTERLVNHKKSSYKEIIIASK